MKKMIETQRAPGAIGPDVQGVDLGSMVSVSYTHLGGNIDLSRVSQITGFVDA